MAGFKRDANGNIIVKKSSVTGAGQPSAGGGDPTWFQKGTYEDGYKFGDLNVGIGGTVVDILGNVAQGVGNFGEGVSDLGLYLGGGLADLFGFDSFAEENKAKAQKNTVSDFFDKYINPTTDKDSFLGEKSDSLAQGVGYVLPSVGVSLVAPHLGIGAVGTSALTTGGTFASSMGSGMSEAYNAGATDSEAWKYGFSSGLIEAGTEMFWGGLGGGARTLGLTSGIGGLDDILANKLTSGLKSRVAKTLVKAGIKATGEGVEEVAAGFLSAIAKHHTYATEKDFDELVKDENLLESFIGGAFVGGVFQVGNVAKSFKTGRDIITGFTSREEAVVDALYNETVNNAKAKGQKLTKSDLAKIREQSEKAVRNGEVSVELIEKTLGGDAQKGLDALSAEADEFDKLYKTPSGELSREQENRRNELEAKNKEKSFDERKKEARQALRQSVLDASAKDQYIGRAYVEEGKKYKAFSANASEYKGKGRAVVENAMKAGFLNDSSATHRFVDLVAKLATEKGIEFDFTSNEKLKNSGFALGGRVINGFESGGKITVNMNAAKALNTVVGHEITHVFEGTKLYNELQTALFRYAQGKKDYNGRRKVLEELYKDVKDANVDAELMADLVGDYLFTDEAFIRRLSTENKNLFEKIFDEIKYLARLATAGSKEARELERVKRLFEKVYKEADARKTDGTRFSLSTENASSPIAPLPGYNVRGEDISLDLGPVRGDIAQKAETKNKGKTVSNTENLAPDFAPISEDEANALQSENIASLDDADAPPETQSVPYNNLPGETSPLPKTVVAKIAHEVRNASYGLKNQDVHKVRQLIDEYAKSEAPSREELKESLSEILTTTAREQTDDLLPEIKNYLKNTKIKVSEDIRRDFENYASEQRHYFGTIGFSKNGLSVDSVYQELNELYPEHFPSDVINPADQLRVMMDVADTQGFEDQEYMPDETELDDVADVIINGINGYRQASAQSAAEAMSRQTAKAANRGDIVPPREFDAPIKDSARSETLKQTETNVKKEEPIKTIQERLEHKLHASYGELSHNKRLRREALEAFDGKIKHLQNEYNSKKNKDTRVANDILRRIENLKRRRAEVDADFTKRINDNRERVEKAKAKFEEGFSEEAGRMMRTELHARMIDDIKNKYSESGLDFDEVLKKAKNLSTFSTVDNTPQRVMEKSLGYKAGQILADETVNKVAQNESEGIKWLNSITSREGKGGLLKQLSEKYHIKPGSKESAAAQMFAEGFYTKDNGEMVTYGSEELAKDFPNVQTQNNIKGLANDPRIRQFYDDTLAKINESRTRNAYPEIKPLDNYFLHFRAMDDTFSRLGIPFNPNDIKAKDLPTDLNGVTADLKPGQPYFASSMHRRGNKTSYDLLGGMERYASGAKNQIYHIDDIQTLRALRNYIADTYGQAKGLDNLDSLSEEEVQDRIKQVYGSHLSNFAKFLNEEANVIAGKTALIDRGVEGIIGRRGIQFLNTLNQQVGSNMVGLNVSSSLTNFLSVAQAFAKTNKTAFVKGFAQTMANKVGHAFGKADSFADNPTAIRRKGADRFYRTPWQKTQDVGYALMGAVDNIATEVIVRGKINEFIAKGMSEQQATIEADKWASKLMGDRSLGQMPQLYNSKMLGLITKFQLEVRNQLDSQFYDTTQEAKASNEDVENKLARNAKTAAKVAVTLAELAVVQHIFGKVFESIAGYNPAFDIIDVLIKMFGWDDEEDSEDTALDNVEQGFLALLEDLPYSSLVTDGGRIPISSALPLEELVTGKDENGIDKSRLETLGEIAPYYALPTGYGQIKKTVKGLSMFSKDLPIAGSYTDSGKLRFPVDDTLKNRVQAGIFGQYANDNARYYFDNDIAPLEAKQIYEYIEVGMPIKDYWKYRKGLSGLKTLNEKGDYIGSLDLPVEQKNILINNIADRETPIDFTGYENYSNFEEFDFATSYPARYIVSQFLGGYETYRDHMKVINKIESDKDENDEPISGSRKKKVLAYILSTKDLDANEKMILYRSLYSDSQYNRAIVDYLAKRSDISYENKLKLLEALGFKVGANGVYW